MSEFEVAAPLPGGGLLDAVSRLHVETYAQSRELRDTIVNEYLATGDDAEREVLLEIYETLMVNLKRSAAPSLRARLQLARALDMRRMHGARPGWPSRVEHWLVTLARPAART